MKIVFCLPVSEPTGPVVHDLPGRTVRQLVDENLPAGAHSVVWDGRDAEGFPAASGAYFYRLTAGTFQQTKRMLLVK